VLTFDASVKSNFVQRIKRPKKLPVSIPLGPALPPPSWIGFSELAAFAKTPDDVALLYNTWKAKAIPELLGVLQCDTSFSAQSYLEGIKLIKVTAMAHCAGYLCAPSPGSTMWYIAHKVEHYVFLAMSANHSKAHDLFVYLMCFKPTCPNIPEWTDLRKRIRLFPSHDHAFLLDTLAWVDSVAAKYELACATNRIKGWQEWCAESCTSPGAAPVHKFIKGHIPWSSFDIRDGQEGTPQENADNRASNWHSNWKVDGKLNSIEWPPIADNLFQGIFEDVAQIRKVTSTYKANTSVGTDFMHPRHFGFLSDHNIGAFIWVAKVMVTFGYTLDSICVLLISLIPKREGGERPIGIFPSFVRIISRIIRYSMGDFGCNRMIDPSYMAERGDRLYSVFGGRLQFVSMRPT